MGTRNLTAVKLGGEYRIAQYGQWDGCPSGQGATAVSFLRSPKNRERLKKALKHCVYVAQGELDAKMKELGIGEWVTWEGAAKFDAAFPFVSRDHGAEILEMVATASKESRPIRLRDSLEFAAESVFCEWAYVVDFDESTFEVYKGFNKTPLKQDERFAGMTTSDTNEKYYPVRLIKSYKLGRLPKPESFVKALNKLCGEEE